MTTAPPDSTELPTQLPTPFPTQLVVLDGTWAQARALYRANPWLGALQHFRIDPAGADRYRIRREPRVGYTSTLEAIVTALGHIEPQTPGLTGLMGAFDTMIDRQVACIDLHHEGARRRPRSRAQHRCVPQALVQHAERTIVLFAEFTQHQEPAGRHRHIVYWTAQRLATGAFFGRFVKPLHADPGPTVRHLEHMGLQGALLHREAVDVATLQQEFATFCGPSPQFLAWNQATLDLLRQDIEGLASAWLLKNIFCTVYRRRGCTLEEATVQMNDPQPFSNPAQGRANARLRATVAVAHGLIEKAKL